MCTSEEKLIYCCGCEKNVVSVLVDGSKIYPHREDLKEIPFWQCNECDNYVGCHYKTTNSTKPLGSIPTAEIRKARGILHQVLDPLWRSGEYNRRQLYKYIAMKLLVTKFHVAELRSVEDARKVYRIVTNIRDNGTSWFHSEYKRLLDTE